MKLWTSDALGNPANCVYPHEITVASAEDLRAAFSHDYVCAKYRNDRRAADAFVSSDCLPMDCDNDHSDREEDWVTPEEVRRLFPGVTMAVHYSRNHMKQKGSRSPRPRFHILFAIAPCADAAAYKALKEQVHAVCPFFDGNALDAARFMFGTAEPEAEWIPGDRTLNEALAEQKTEDAFAARPFPGERIPEGKRNQTLSVCAAKLLKRYGNRRETLDQFMERAAMCDPPLAEKELKQIWYSACRFYTKISRLESYVPPEAYRAENTLRPKYLTELAEARILAEEYRDRLRYSAATQYLVYENGVWVENNEKAKGVMCELAERQLKEHEARLAEVRQQLENANRSVRDAGQLSGTPAQLRARKAEAKYQLEAARLLDKGEEQYESFLLSCCNNVRATAVLELAKSMLLVDASDLDAHPFLLNTPAGEVDLRTGEMLPHDPRHYHTRMTKVAPSVENMELWLAHIDEVTCGDRELARYFQLTSGEELIGAVKNECLRIEIGSGANGKSTYTNTKLRVLADYGGSLSSETLTVQSRYQKNWEIGELRGKRLIVAGELEEGQRLNDAFVKKICSSDAIVGEKKFKDTFQFLPSHTIVLYTNHLPKVTSRDRGIWRRLKVIPFNASLSGSGKYKNYTDYLVEHCGGAVLQWMIEGAKQFIAADFEIEEPPCVRVAIEDYRSGSDWLGQFLTECCRSVPGAEIRSGELYQRYREFAASRGERPKGIQEFGVALAQAGYERNHTRKGNVICGLMIRREDEPGMDGYREFMEE